MLNTIIPTSRYNKTSYPNLEDRADGMPIPLCYGAITNITPVIIDQAAHQYKICSNTLASIDEVRADGVALTEGVDYTDDLANGEFSFDTGSPLCTGGVTYYMIWTADYAVSAVNYIWVVSRDNSFYGDGTMYFIDNLDAWTDQLVDATFKIYGRKVPSGAEELLVDGSSTAGNVQNQGLRSAAARTKIAQSFELPGADDYYITRIQWKTRKIGAPVGDAWIEIHSDQAGTQVGAVSAKVDVSTLKTASYWQGDSLWSVINAEDIKVDATGEYNQVDNILDDVLQNVLSVAAADIDAAALAALGVARTENLAAYIASERKFQAFVEKLEAGQLFKFLTKLDGTYTVTFYAAGAADIELSDEDFISFTSYRDLGAVYRTIKIKYNENPTDQTFSIAEASSDVAEYLYENFETLEVETYLVSSANAATLAADYIGLLEYPQRYIEFEVSGYGWDLIPTKKVSITRTRGDNTSGTFSSVIFRILSIRKSLSRGTTKMLAVLDTQTY